MAKSSKAINLLTAREVLSAGDGDLADGGGLYLRVDARRHTASWVYRYTAPSGKRREMGLGAVQRNTLKQVGESLTNAREAAEEQRRILRNGDDPLDERDRRKQAAREADKARRAEKEQNHWTVIRCARDYHARVIEKTRTPKHAAQWIASLENHLPPSIRNRPIAEVTPPELLRALEAAEPLDSARRAGDLGETLRRVRQRLEAIWEDAIFYERATTNAAQGIRRKLRETRPVNEKGKLKALDYREAPALMARLREMPGVSARSLEFAVLTASRTDEVLKAEWSEFNLNERVWVIPGPRMKRGEEHIVYLSDRVVEILRGQMGQDARYVFPSTQKPRVIPDGENAESIKKRPQSNMALLATLGRLNIRDKTTVHGLCRATFSTWANETGAARPDVVEAALAHKEADLVRRSYNRAEFANERRALLDAWAAYLAKPAAVALKVVNGGAE